MMVLLDRIDYYELILLVAAVECKTDRLSSATQYLVQDK
jgi:hypothetical protein